MLFHMCFPPHFGINSPSSLTVIQCVSPRNGEAHWALNPDLSNLTPMQILIQETNARCLILRYRSEAARSERQTIGVSIR